jgi:hypothetical protein
MMMKTWAAFAADPANGLSNIGWPKYSEGQPTVVTVGQNNQPSFGLDLPSNFDSPCSTIMLAISATELPTA